MPSILKLTPRRLHVYDFILKYKQDHDGVSPSVSEIAQGCQISSTSLVCHDLDFLSVLGMIRCGGGVGRKSRMISIPGGRWFPPYSVTQVSPTKTGVSARISSSIKS